MLQDVGKIVPHSSKGLSRTQRMMIRAGYRRPELVLAMEGAKVLAPLAAIGLVYVTGLYLFEPFLVLPMAAVAGFSLPEIWLSSRVRRRQRLIPRALPDAMDLLVVCVEAGLGIDQAIQRVAREIHRPSPELSEELDLINWEMRVGKSRVEALRSLGERTGVDEVRGLSAMLIQTDRFGTELGRSMRIHSENLRARRRQRAEEMAAKMSIKMVPALVFFIFPALFVVLLGPAVIGLVRELLPTLK